MLLLLKFVNSILLPSLNESNLRALYLSAVICYLFCGTSPQQTQAQSLSINHYTTSEGLGASVVHTLHQDSKGYLWVSSDAGLNRFDGEEFRLFTSKDGIGAETISSIHEDIKGQMWFKSRGMNGTSLLMYNGTRFSRIPEDSILVYGQDAGGVLAYRDQYEPLWLKKKNYLELIHPTNKIKIPYDPVFDSNYIYDIETVEPNHYIIATIRGLIEYKDGFYHNHTKVQRQTTQFHELCSFKNQNDLWAITDEGLYFFNGCELSQEGIPKKLKRNVIHNMGQTQNGQIWLATVYGLYTYVDGQFSTLPDLGQIGRVNNVFIDSRDHLWLSTDKGLWVYHDNKLDLLDGNTEFNMMSGLWTSFWRRFGLDYRQVLEDFEGNIWFNTNEGICKFAGFHLKQYTSENGLINNNIKSIIRDKKGNLWLGYNEDGIAKCIGDSCVQWTEKDGLPSNRINGLVQNDKDELWASCNSGLLQFNHDLNSWKQVDKDAITSSVRYLQLDQKDRIWFSHKGTVFCKDEDRLTEYEHKSESGSSRGFMCMFIDSKNQVWTSDYKGLYLLKSGEGQSFELAGNSEQLGWIGAIAEDDTGALWMVNMKGGLFRYDKGYITRIDELDGLSTNAIRSVLVKNNNVYLGTINGIDVFNIQQFLETKKVQVTNIGFDDGLQAKECSLLAYSDPDGSLWFGNKDGLLQYQPEPIQNRKFSEEIPLHITSVRLNYQAVDWPAYSDSLDHYTGLPKELLLSPKENTLTFNYKALSFGNSERYSYKYKLNGYDEEWQLGSRDNTTSYPVLNSGYYSFAVRLYNGEELLAESRPFNFTIDQPIYKKGWFILYSLVFILLISVSIGLIIKYIIYRRNKRRLQF